MENVNINIRNCIAIRGIRKQRETYVHTSELKSRTLPGKREIREDEKSVSEKERLERTRKV
jgi:hypothetical protein